MKNGSYQIDFFLGRWWIRKFFKAQFFDGFNTLFSSFDSQYYSQNYWFLIFKVLQFSRGYLASDFGIQMVQNVDVFNSEDFVNFLRFLTYDELGYLAHPIFIEVKRKVDSMPRFAASWYPLIDVN